MRTRSSTKTLRQAGWVLVLLFTLLVPTNFILGQTSNTGTLTGVVKDEKGAAIPGASVKLINLGTNAERTTTASSEGLYEIPQLVPGTYRLEIEAPGFSKSVVENVVVNVLQRTTVNPELK